MKKIASIILIFFMTCLCAFAQGKNEISLEAELGKIIVEKSDQMTLKFFERPFSEHQKISGFYFKGREYNHYELYKSFWNALTFSKELSAEARGLFFSAGKEVAAQFDKALFHYSEGDSLEGDIEFIHAVMRFNHAISHSEIARKSAADIMRKAFTPQVKQQRLERKWQDKRLFYFGVYGGLLFYSEPDIQGTTYSNPIGIRFEYYLLKPFSSFNIGMGMGVGYMNVVGLKKTVADRVFITYFTSNPMLLFKFFFPEISYKHCFILGLGGEINVKLSGEEFSNSIIKNIHGGLAIEIGYRYISAGLSTTIGINISLKVMDSFIESNFEGVSFGFNVFVGF